MDHIEGSLRILRLSHETEPEPWTYELSFVPYAASSIPPACDVVGDDQLERALLYGLGLREPHLDSSVQKARHDNVVIHHVHLTDELKTLLDDVMQSFANLARRRVLDVHRLNPEGAGEGESRLADRVALVEQMQRVLLAAADGAQDLILSSDLDREAMRILSKI